MLEAARRMREQAMGGLQQQQDDTPDAKRPKTDALPPRLQQLPPRAQPPPSRAALPPRTAPLRSQNNIERAPVTEQPLITPKPTPDNRISGNNPKSVIEVSSKQLENDLLNYINGWKENKFLKDADYVVNGEIAVLYLSLEFHKVRPGYIEKRMGGLRQNGCRIVLLHIDTGDWEKSLAELNAFALFHGLTLVVGWSNAECGEYLTFLRTVKAATLIKQRRTDDTQVLGDQRRFQERASQLLRCSPRMDKTTAAALLARHSSLAKVVSLEPQELQLVDRMGLQRAKLLYETFNAPFTVAQQQPESGKM